MPTSFYKKLASDGNWLPQEVERLRQFSDQTYPLLPQARSRQGFANLGVGCCSQLDRKPVVERGWSEDVVKAGFDTDDFKGKYGNVPPILVNKTPIKQC